MNYFIYFTPLCSLLESFPNVEKKITSQISRSKIAMIQEHYVISHRNLLLLLLLYYT